MTYNFHNSTLQEITDKILYEKNVISKLDSDINNLECFLSKENIKFGEIDSPNDGFIGVNDQGHLITFFRNDPFDEPMPFNDDSIFGVKLITDLNSWMKIQHFEYILMHMKSILDDMRAEA